MDHNRDDESPSAANYCVACHVRATYNMLTHSIEIIRALALGNGTNASLPTNAATLAYP